MTMNLGRAYCSELDITLSPYKAREIYTDEDDDNFNKQLTFQCEDEKCRKILTPVGIYMTRKSKRALHFRAKKGHEVGCGFLHHLKNGGKIRRPVENEDDYKPTYFPTELDLDPPKRKNKSNALTASSHTEPATIETGTSFNGDEKRKTKTKTRYLDLVVDCFMSGDDESKKGYFTIAGKTKKFYQFFKKIQYFGDEAGLIYYGTIDKLNMYKKDYGIGIRFLSPHVADKKRTRIWLNIPQACIDESRRKTSFLNEITELKNAVDGGESVDAFFVGAYPSKILIEKDGDSFESFSADLKSVDHLSLVFSK
ncbi:MAG: hypothetical protein EOO53_16010 [Gammaproteobacteria bacterium]|nr:MAG: hypothetical protein EOO53_16010 [Gammaproteobacteria bacterium]